MNKSIYTEYANLTPYQIKWLDECGATFEDGFLVGGWEPKLLKNLLFRKGADGHYYLYLTNTVIESLTGDAFCQGVAEILGIEYVPEGTKSETVTEDKGLAIDVKLLSEKDIEALLEMCGEAWAEVPKQALKNKNERYLYYRDGGLDCHHKMALKNIGLTITTDPTEFMRYVATKTGKEWKPKEFLKNFEPNDEEINKGIENAIKQSDKDDWKIWTYPHKTYRVLDSLAGVPLEKRIPLSEWIPPIEERVCFIWDKLFCVGCFVEINSEGFWIQQDNGKGMNANLDGHWMRIL